MLQMAKTPSENILKLRELTDKICNVSPNSDLEIALRELKIIVDEGNKEVNVSVTPQKKLKCYEKMYTTITNILNTVSI
jgi:hypothetical protein